MRVCSRLGLIVLLGLFPVSMALAQTGKIAGTVTTADGEPLPGVNVILDGTTQGTSTDADGFYTIINVRPGTYDVRATFIGYVPSVREDVRVQIDLTAEVNFEMQEEAVGLEEVVVSADQEVVKRDLSASRVDVSAEQIENLPVTDISEVVGLQAGVQGLDIRGSSADEAAFIVDGLNLGTRRDNTPYTGISYSAIEEVQIQSGGFTAEYGNMRSGVVNVVTKEGGRNRYSADIVARYSPPNEKYFGIAPDDPNSYWMRPYLDPTTAFEGTDQWDDFTQLQFPRFDGFNTISQSTMSDEDPNNDLTPQQAQDLFLFRHRRDLEVTEPDYVIDGGFGGPVPGISKALGDLRFYASFRTEQSQYIIPLTRDGYDEFNGRLKLTSDVGPGMKLSVEGMRAELRGTSEDYPRNGPTRLIKDGDPQYTVGNDGLPQYSRGEDQIFGTGSLSIGDISHTLFGGKFTHSLSPTTFYEIKLQRFESDYFTRPPRTRNTDPIQCFGNYCVDEAPFGFSFEPINSLEGMRMGAHWSEFRDTTNIVEYAGRFDFTNQVNRTNMVKMGVELSVTPQDVSYAYPDFLTNPDDVRVQWNTTEIYGAAYIQDKLEFRGMIANVGLRLDYLDPNIDWFVYEDPYSDAFMGKFADEFPELLETEQISPQLRLSPRLGVSFPVTETSKLYFNYGHAYQRPHPEDMYRLERSLLTEQVTRIANPEAPMQFTTQYELGYEQSLFDRFLVRVAGYYKDVRDEPRLVTFTNRNGLVSYSVNVPDNYRDTRGIEISLFKNAGRWVRGFVNYTYMVESSGNFGFGQYNENRVEQRIYERTTTDYYQSKPLPQPFARANLEFISPADYGQLLGDWRLTLLGRWQAGEFFTYAGRNPVPGVSNNMQWKSYRMVDMRVSKSIDLGFGLQRLLLFADITNVFNIKNFNASSFAGGEDYPSYINSLRLPADMIEGWEDQYQHKDSNGNPITGDDVPGTLDKDYIDPPNISSFRYLFPRNVNFGLRFSF